MSLPTYSQAALNLTIVLKGVGRATYETLLSPDIVVHGRYEQFALDPTQTIQLEIVAGRFGSLGELGHPLALLLQMALELLERTMAQVGRICGEVLSCFVVGQASIDVHLGWIALLY